jgi:putative transposase
VLRPGGGKVLLQAGAAFEPIPREIVTDPLRSYPTAKVQEPAGVKHVFVKASARVNNRAENGHQPTRRRERQMRVFRDLRRTSDVSLALHPDRTAHRLAKAPDECGRPSHHTSGTPFHLSGLGGRERGQR